LLLAGLLLAVSIERSPHSEANNRRTLTNDQPPRAYLAEQVSVTAAGHGNPTLNLGDGHAVVTSFKGPEELQQALSLNHAEPLSLASADFDEDGVPDLVSGYGFRGHGILSVLRGNVDAIYPNAPEAQQRRAAGVATSAPFLSPGSVFASPAIADFVGAGDFDADGHWDIVVASRTSNALNLFSGDGRGGFASPREIDLPGVVTAMTTGEINRADGLTDLVVGVSSERGSEVLVFEGPEGALRAGPEVIKLGAPITSLALGQLAGDYAFDLVVATGNQLLMVQGRDRKLSLDETQRARAAPPVIAGRLFETQIREVAVGRFSDDDSSEIVAVTDSGDLQLLTPQARKLSTAHTNNPFNNWKSRLVVDDRWPKARVFSARLSNSKHDDLIVVDATKRQLHIVVSGASLVTESVSNDRFVASLDLMEPPVAVLAMRLNSDALNDLTLLSSGNSAPVVVPTQATTTFVVTNTNATGPGSLLFAIADANESPGADLITFNIPGAPPYVINQTVQLPNVTDPVTIDGTTQPGFGGTPVVELIYAGNFNGLMFKVGNNTFRGIAMTAPGVPALEFQQGGNNIVEGNFLGTNVSGTQTLSGGDVLIHTSNNRIGGTTTAARNLVQVISSYQLSGGLGDGNLILGNFIGVTINGDSAGTGGRVVINTPATTIGGTIAGARNVIVGEVTIVTANTAVNLIQGNYVGTNAAGTVALSGRGIFLDTVATTVGGTTPTARNLISGNTLPGVRITTANSALPASSNLVQGNFIGTNVNGTADLGNQGYGVVVDGFLKPGTTIGGAATGAQNLIANNRSGGVEISAGQGGVVVLGNRIGTDAAGIVDLGNLQNGVHIFNSPNNIIGGTDPAARNVISGNGLSGVLIEGSLSTGNFVQGNFIGTNAAGTAALGNDLNGVTTSEAPNNTIGGSIVEARNIISANARHGVSIGIDTNSGATGITVQNNFIGTDLTGNNCLGNGRDGVFVNRGSVNHTITDNLITCNLRNGVNIPNFASNDPGIRIAITRNLIYANASLGIDLGDPGITPDDPGDADVGANFLQNFAVLNSIGNPIAPPEQGGAKEWFELNGPEVPRRSDTIYTVFSQLNSTPNTTFTVHWYYSADQQCVANQQPSRPLAFGRVPGVTTDANGDASFNFTFEFPPGLTSGTINSTTTDPSGNTSEFSSCLQVSVQAPAATMQFSSTGYTVNEGGVSALIAVTRTGDTAGPSTVDFAASDGTAKQYQDYVITSGTLNFAAGETSKTFSVLVVDDAFVENSETINLTLSNATGGALGLPGAATLSITDNDTVSGTVPLPRRFAAILNGAQETPPNNSLAKGTGLVLLSQSETSAQVGVQFQSLGSAETAAHIHGPSAPGVAAPILFPLPSTNPVINFAISPTAQQVSDLKAGLHYQNVHSNNFANGEIRGQLLWNPTLEESFFVRQQYLDFLSRDGDPGGFNFWLNQVGSCQADAQCFHDRTITTSNAFFFEPEFQQTAGYVFRVYRAAYGNSQPFPNPDGSNATEANKLIDYSAFVADRARVVGGANLAAAQQAFANQFVLRPDFKGRYSSSLTSAQFVDAILATIQNADGVNLSAQRQALIDQYDNEGTDDAGRAKVLYRLADDNTQSPINNQAFINAEYNRQFALTLYFGYLRRNPDIGGFLFWQSQINLAPLRDVPKQNALVCSFLTAAEYQLRFGPNAPRSNAECPQ
jgi:hypothetical protein